MKLIFGTNIMFYEVGIVDEYCSSIRHALTSFNLKDLGIFVNLDFLINIDTTFESPTGKSISELDAEISSAIYGKLADLQNENIKINLRSSKTFRPPYTMVNYRRELNNKCLEYDLVVWGETDCLLPKTFFINLLQVFEYAESNFVPKYVVTFADRKMWDETWKPLEHPEFTNKPYYERTDPRSITELHSIRYTMNQTELDSINRPYEESIELKINRYPKFDGSLLCISSELIASGANIPLGYWGISGEDEVMMHECYRVAHDRYTQFIISNICKGHNREHPNKRQNVISNADLSVSTQGSKGGWYKVLRDINKGNIRILYDPAIKTKLLTYQDFKQTMQHGIHTTK